MSAGDEAPAATREVTGAGGEGAAARDDANATAARAAGATAAGEVGATCGCATAPDLDDDRRPAAGEGAERTPWTAWPFIMLVRGYQLTLRPFMGMHCRFQPTCSDYSIQAYRRFGAVRGTWLTVHRLARCQPWGGAGFDPVPERGRARGRRGGRAS